jgi:predicted phosphodiesterase
MTTATKRLTRRDLLRLGAGSLLAAGLWPGALRAADARADDFHFLVVNDTHAFDEKNDKEDKDVEWLERVVKQMKGHDQKPVFCLHLGDVSDRGKKDELEKGRDAFKKLGLPVYYVPGNHDYKAPDDRNAFEECFPKSLNYHFDHGGWQLVAIDSTDGKKAVLANVQKDALKYLDDTLPKMDKKKPMILFTHFPLGPGHITRPSNAEEVLARFKDYNLRAVFSGHYHALTERTVGPVVLTTNRCCSLHRGNHDGSPEKGYFLCHAKDGKVAHEFVEVKPAGACADSGGQLRRWSQ